MKRNKKILVGDFETTVYEGQEKTEVWASAVVELFSDNPILFHSISDTFNYFKSLKSNIIVYYHNLKFDGNFWLSYLMKELNYSQALYGTNKETNEYLQITSPDDIALFTDIHWLQNKEMLNNTFKYAISDRGQWYDIVIKTGGHIIEIRDSLKLLPFSVKKIGRDFKTKHQKTEIEYKGLRYAGCYISPEEEEYIKNDVMVVKEALEIMFGEGHDSLTIGSCCLSEFKKNFSFSTENYDVDKFDSCGNEKDLSFFFREKQQRRPTAIQRIFSESIRSAA